MENMGIFMIVKTYIIIVSSIWVLCLRLGHLCCVSCPFLIEIMNICAVKRKSFFVIQNGCSKIEILWMSVLNVFIYTGNSIVERLWGNWDERLKVISWSVLSLGAVLFYVIFKSPMRSNMINSLSPSYKTPTDNMRANTPTSTTHYTDQMNSLHRALLKQT